MLNRNVEKRVTALETKVSVIETKVDSFIEEMRDRDNQRATEISELRQKQESDMKEIRTSIDSMGKHVRNVSIATIAVCVATAIGSITIALSILLK